MYGNYKLCNTGIVLKNSINLFCLWMSANKAQGNGHLTNSVLFPCNVTRLFFLMLEYLTIRLCNKKLCHVHLFKIIFNL